MITVADAVHEILSEDGLVVEAMQRGVLNISAYAKEILAEVEARTKKPVQLGTVVVALSRSANHPHPISPLSPPIVIDQYTITTDLCDVAYDKTDQVMSDLSRINHSFIDNANAFWAMTMGGNEVTIICSTMIAPRIVDSIGMQPKSRMGAMAAISVRFSELYMETPNAIYSLVGALALRQINVWEIVSTYTEVIFVITENELETALSALQTYQRKTQKSKK